MPKLDGDAAAKVDAAESTGGVMEEGLQETVLISVEPGNGPKGPYWKWTFKNPEDAPRYAGWQHWVTTSLSETAAWKLKEVFAAFGVPTDTDTDDLIGQRVMVDVGTRTIQEGARAGEQTNTVKSVLPLEGGLKAEATGKKGSGKAEKNLF